MCTGWDSSEISKKLLTGDNKLLISYILFHMSLTFVSLSGSTVSPPLSSLSLPWPMVEFNTVKSPEYWSLTQWMTLEVSTATRPLVNNWAYFSWSMKDSPTHKLITLTQKVGQQLHVYNIHSSHLLTCLAKIMISICWEINLVFLLSEHIDNPVSL